MNRAQIKEDPLVQRRNGQFTQRVMNINWR
jgi:hypothetical protein